MAFSSRNVPWNSLCVSGKLHESTWEVAEVSVKFLKVASVFLESNNISGKACALLYGHK